VADYQVAQAGTSIRVGVFFELQPGWHIYAQDPGESGLPTKITFQGPEGFVFSPLLWPQHKIFTSAGNIKGNGYSKEVLLWSRVDIPQGVVGEQRILLKASWLNCSEDLCVPQRKNFEMPLLIGEAKEGPEKALFDLWETKLP
jgi:thiol:disulfide interchange protein DsbD